MKDGCKDSVLGKIPVSWDIVKLEDITCKISDGIHTTPKYVEKSNCFFINGNNLNNGRIQLLETSKCVDENEFLKHKRDLDFNTVLLSINGTIGNIAFYNGEKVILGKSAAYIKCNDSTTKRFIFYQLQSKRVQSYFAKELTGTTIKNLSLKTLKNTPVTFPPLTEQQKIADILTTVDDKLENIESQIAEYSNLKTGLMQQLLTKGIGHTKFVESELGMIPEGWKVVKLGDLGCFKSGGTPKTNVPDYWNGNIYWCTPTEITALNGRKYISKTERLITKKGIVNSGAELIPVNSLLVCTRATIGDCAINTIEMTTNQGFKSIVPNEKVKIDYLYYLVNFIKPELIKNSSGSTFLEISKHNFSKIKVALPNIQEQQKIADTITAIDDKIESFQQKKEEFSNLKKGLMEQLLTGRIRVKV